MDDFIAWAEADGFGTLREAVELACRDDWLGYDAALRDGTPYPDPIHDEIRFAEGIERVRLAGQPCLRDESLVLDNPFGTPTCAAAR